MYQYDISGLYNILPTELRTEAISYWLYKKRELISQRFTNDFIIQSLKSVLKYNNVLFDDYMYLQLLGAAKGTKRALSYPCLTVGDLEETKLFTKELLNYLNQSDSKLIMELLKHYMDDDFIFWPSKLNFQNFKTCLNNIHSSIKFAFEKPEIIDENVKKVQVLKFLDVKLILHEDNSVETEIYYKPPNTHGYLQ